MNKQIHIALIGHGRMGRAIEELALKLGHSIAAVIDNEEDWINKSENLQKADVAIEFSTPEAAPENIRRCFERNIPVVSGTTGWYDQLPAVSKECLDKQQAFFYAPNFSIGMNVFFEINEKLAAILSEMEGYKTRITEIHHTGKLDAPSGTAIKLAGDIIKHRKNTSGWVLEEQRQNDQQLPVRAIRQDQVTGTHEVIYESAIDTIAIKHVAHNRSGFVEGALLAAVWLCGRQGIFTMKDLLNL